MNTYWKIKDLFYFFIPCLLILTGCGNDGGDDPQPTGDPTITAINPVSGPEGTLVTITGTNFSSNASENAVTLNGMATSVSSASSTSIEFTVPMGASTGNVAVTVNGKSVTGPVFTVEVNNSLAIVYDCAESEITENTTWEDVNSGNEVDYIITCEISVKANALLTIEPGVIIQFEGNQAGIFTSESGGLKAIGTSSDPIQFIGTSPTPGVWKGVYFGSTHPENRLEYVTVSHAGRTESSRSNEKGAVQLNDEEDSKGAVVNCTITNNDGYGFVVTDESDLTEFSDNTISNNEQAPVLIYFNQLGNLDTGTNYENNDENYIEVRHNKLEDESMIINNPGIPYRFIESQKYNVLKDMTIAAGTTLEFSVGAGIRLGDQATDCTPATGSIKAMGTETERITFKGIVDGPGSWLGIGINSSSPNNQLIYCDIIDGGGGQIYNNSNVKHAGVALACEGKVTMQESNIISSDAFGIYVDREEAELVDFENNVISENGLSPVGLHFSQIDQLDASNQYNGNNANSYIEVRGSGLQDNDLTIPKLDVPYRILPNPGGGKTFIEKNLFISPGVIMEFETGTGLVLGSAGVDCIPLTGSINAEGTMEEKIILKGANDGQGTWIGIGINSGSSLNVFDFVEISGGGSQQLYNAGGQGNFVLQCEADLTITNSTIKDSGGWGIDFVNGSLSLTESNNTFDNNNSGNVND